MRCAFIVSLIALTSGCAGHCTERFIAAPVPSRQATLERFEAADQAVVFTVPLWIDGVSRAVAIDTGASRSLLGEGMLFLAGAQPTDSVDATDATSRDIEVRRYTRPARIILLEGIDTTDDIYGVPMEPLEALGIGGLISPQRLAPDGHALRLDFPRRTVELIELDDHELTAMIPLAPACDGLLTVNVAVGAEALTLVVDTGAWQTGFSGARQGTARGTTEVWSLAGRRTDEVFDADLRIGPGQWHVTAYDVASPSCGDGVVGLDVLSGCVLVVHRDGGGLLCDEAE